MTAHRVGLVAPARDPQTPVLEARLAEAKRLAEPGLSAVR